MTIVFYDYVYKCIKYTYILRSGSSGIVCSCLATLSRAILARTSLCIDSLAIESLAIDSLSRWTEMARRWCSRNDPPTTSSLESLSSSLKQKWHEYNKYLYCGVSCLFYVSYKIILIMLITCWVNLTLNPALHWWLAEDPQLFSMPILNHCGQ